ncbi:c-type cytochrome [Kordiimonas sp.]|uniref:c-type cytochrome n=1 Tax=Kordiimonas sp. TaxID=1970157 RepID=UPI003A8F800B
MPVLPDIAVKKARNDWMLNCQGCHQANGAGSQGGAPDMRGIVARLLAVDGGRAYLGQVPGVAYAPLDDQSLANLLNWLLQEYDPENLSNDFQPYTAQEIGSLRGMPLIEEAPEIRAELITMLQGASSTDN